MIDLLLRIYHRLPTPLRSGVASVYGLRAYLQRYSADTEWLVAEAHAREGWSHAQWQAWQAERLSAILERAATQVPYYRNHWRERRRRGDRASWAYLEHWPLLDKEPLRANPLAFVADDCNPRRMIHEHTSGTSGKPLNLWFSQATVRNWYALFEARTLRWHEVSRFDRWGIMGGRLVTPVRQQHPPFWVWNAGMRQLYLSSYHLAPQHVPAYLDALKRYKITYLYGYSSSLYALAQAVIEQKLAAPSMRVAFSNAEPLFAHQRATISAAFGCPTRETYGMSELVCGAGECTQEKMHLWPEAGIVEVLDDDNDQPVARGTTGQLVCTGLINRDMPLIRYRVGDRGTLALDNDSCTCGRALPILHSIEGRMDDVILTADGRRVGRLDPVFKQDLLVREVQIIQENLNLIRVRFVPASGYSQRDEASIAQRLRDRVGPMDLIFEAVEEIPRSANGKFRAVISHVKAQKGSVTEHAASH